MINSEVNDLPWRYSTPAQARPPDSRFGMNSTFVRQGSENGLSKHIAVWIEVSVEINDSVSRLDVLLMTRSKNLTCGCQCFNALCFFNSYLSLPHVRGHYCPSERRSPLGLSDSKQSDALFKLCPPLRLLTKARMCDAAFINTFSSI